MHRFPPAVGETKAWEVMCFFIMTRKASLRFAFVIPFTCSKAIQLLLARVELCAPLFSYNTWERFSMQTSLYSWFVILFKHLQFGFALHFKTTSCLGKWPCLPLATIQVTVWNVTAGYLERPELRLPISSLACVHKTVWNFILWIILKVIAEKSPCSSKCFNVIFVPKTQLFSWKQEFFSTKVHHWKLEWKDIFKSNKGHCDLKL